MNRSTGLAIALCTVVLAAATGVADSPPEKSKSRAANPAAVFKRIDTNGDGKLSKEEFKSFIDNATKGKIKAKPELIEKLFNRLDSDGDGYLSLDEFKKLRDLREKLVEKKKAKKGSEPAGANE
jgi:hypothetical protein